MSRTLISLRAVLVTAIACVGVLAMSTLDGVAAQAGELPDGRGYEKVSPNDNNAGDVTPPIPGPLARVGWDNEEPFVAAADGEAFAYMADPSETGGDAHAGNTGGNEYLATRNTGGGWSAANMTPASQNVHDEPVYEGFSTNLTAGFLGSKLVAPLAPGAPSGGYNVPYVRDFATGTYESLLLETPPNRNTKQFGSFSWKVPSLPALHYPIFGGASADFSHVLYMANDALTPNAVAGSSQEDNLYEYHDGGLTLVNVLPDGSTESGATFGGPAVEPDEPEYNGPALNNVISEDGTRIFWTGLGVNHNIYLREDGERTVQVDASAGGEGQFWSATPDGAKALFMKEGNLYEYDVESHQTIDLVPGAEVQGVLGTSRDMGYVYFIARGALAPGAEPQLCELKGDVSSGLCNLYVIHGETVKFVGALEAKDESILLKSSFYRNDGPWKASPGARESQVSPDGLHLLFGSRAPLTGYDNRSVSKSEPNEELYVYDFEASKITCVSCDPTGKPPTGTYSAFLPASNMAAYTHRWMSEDGDQVFFDSFDALVPQDTNGLLDVYEWERGGSGDCGQADGCIYLLTAGVGSENSYLLDTSVSGDDVFFATRSKLIAEDENEEIDVYDARVGATPPPVAPACSGTGCQGVPSAPPIFATPSSVTYNGVGDFVTPSKTTVAKTKTKKHVVHKVKKRKKKRAKKSERAAAKRAARGKEGISAEHGPRMIHGRSK